MHEGSNRLLISGAAVGGTLALSGAVCLLVYGIKKRSGNGGPGATRSPRLTVGLENRMNRLDVFYSIRF